MTGHARSAELLESHRAQFARPATIGHDLTAHRDLGFCQACHPQGMSGELIGWRLLAMAERGVPDQPGKTT